MPGERSTDRLDSVNLYGDVCKSVTAPQLGSVVQRGAVGVRDDGRQAGAGTWPDLPDMEIDDLRPRQSFQMSAEARRKLGRRDHVEKLRRGVTAEEKAPSEK
jgi:hypothetical protein